MHRFHHVEDLELEELPFDPATIVSGSPRQFIKVLWEAPDGSRARGVWEMTPGVVDDVEADEMFTLVTGRVTLETEDGRRVDLGPGDVGVLEAGVRTRWTVHETIRKTYDARYDVT